jgi:hypothetical protein
MWSRARVLSVFAACGFLFPVTAASAQKSDKGTVKLSNKKRTTYPLRHKEGEYGGVTPGVVYRYRFELEKKGSKRVQRRVKRRKNRHPNGRLTISWVGFQPRGGGASRVFFQLNREAQFTQQVEKNVLVVTIEGARYGSRNARRKVVTRYFETAIDRIDTKRVRSRRARKDRPARKGGIAFFIHFKNPADARQASADQKKSDKDGYYYLNLDFGAGTPLPPGKNDKGK